MRCLYKNRSHCKNISKEKIRRYLFVVCVNLPTVKIWRQSDKFSMRNQLLEGNLQSVISLMFFCLSQLLIGFLYLKEAFSYYLATL